MVDYRRGRIGSSCGLSSHVDLEVLDLPWQFTDSRVVHNPPLVEQQHYFVSAQFLNRSWVFQVMVIVLVIDAKVHNCGSTRLVEDTEVLGVNVQKIAQSSLDIFVSGGLTRSIEHDTSTDISIRQASCTFFPRVFARATSGATS